MWDFIKKRIRQWGLGSFVFIVGVNFLYFYILLAQFNMEMLNLISVK